MLPVGRSRAAEVALTFDDLPTHNTLPAGLTRTDVAKSIIATLREWNVPEAFGFINADKLEREPEGMNVLKLWRAAGFPLGNHTFSHMNLHANSVDAFRQDIALNEPTPRSLMGSEDWRWFRYPYLREGDTLEKRNAVIDYLQERKYKIAHTTIDFEDYAWNGPYARCTDKGDTEAIEWLKASYLEAAAEYISVSLRLSRLVYGRDVKHVMLLHIGGFKTVMLGPLLELLRERGFKFITLAQAHSDPAFESIPNLAAKWGDTLLVRMMKAKRLKLPPHKEKPFERLEAVCR